jgi:hypothetical protein
VRCDVILYTVVKYMYGSSRTGEIAVYCSRVQIVSALLCTKPLPPSLIPQHISHTISSRLPSVRRDRIQTEKSRIEKTIYLSKFEYNGKTFLRRLLIELSKTSLGDLINVC